MADHDDTPLFSAVSSSARQLSLLLRCISFASKVQVRISSQGLRFSAGTSVMEAFVFLSTDLFSTYTYTDSSSPHDLPEDLPPPPTFEISLPALLETLQIFSLSDPSQKPYSDNTSTSFASHRLNRHANHPFSSTILGTNNHCRLTYPSPGSPLTISLSDSSGVRTTAALTTYTPSASDADIPFARDAVHFKTILRAQHLHDAILELGAVNADTLVLSASPRAPYLVLASQGAPLGDACVEFHAKDEGRVLEVFSCASRFEARYSFGMVKAASRAMGVAAKVSVRADAQGVLSLQFLVEVENARGGGEGAAFVDFRVVPLVEDEEGDGDGDGESEGDSD